MTDQNNIYDNFQVTANSEQIAVLKKHFPNCFDKDGRFLIDNLKDIVAKEGVDTSHEGYKLDWLGKSYARLLANEKPRTLITPNNEHNAKDLNKSSNNLLIKGDNLEVLKHLKNAYTESVKVIYIDPPYNTGSDGFVYQDDRKFTKEELANLANVSEEDAQRILDFTDRGSNSHSAWLTFIYPRLYVARELLREDGVIFISIDDNEQAQLKLLCDEVFGEENYVQEIIWQKKFAPQNDAKYFSYNHEQIYCYSKSKDLFSRNLLPMTKDQISRYKNLDNDPRGPWQSDNLTVATYSQSYDFPIEKPNGEIVNPPHGRCWRTSKEKFKELILDNRVWFGNDGSGVPRIKRFLSEIQQGMVPISIFYHEEVGHTQEASKSLKSLFGEKKYFDYPKPVNLVKRCLQIGSSKDSLILDFFAGSGTTAHAVMDMNADDGGNRQYILVQLPEETDKKSEAYKAGYKTIFDITKARIEKAAEKIKAEKPNYEGDLGFKIFETTPLPEYYDEQIDKLTPDAQGKIWDGSSADNSLLQAILTSCTLYDRILLTTDLQTITLSNNYIAYYGIGKGSNTLYLMHKGFTIDNIKDIIDKLEKEKTFTPDKMVIYGHNFDSKSQRELSESMLNFKNKKQLDIDVIIRY